MKKVFIIQKFSYDDAGHLLCSSILDNLFLPSFAEAKSYLLEESIYAPHILTFCEGTCAEFYSLNINGNEFQFEIVELRNI